jgi:MscS family membrane protein
LLLAGLFNFSASAQEASENQPVQAEAEAADAALDPLAELDLSTPRATLVSFLAAMNSVHSDKPEFIEVAIACFNLEEVPEEQRVAEGGRLAEDLYQALSAIVLDQQVVPESSDSRNVEVSVGPNAEVPLYFRLNDDDLWRFSRSRLEEDIEAIRDVAQEAAEATAVVNADVDPELANPRATMQTFLNAMDAWESGGQEQAGKTLDLSGLGESVRDETSARVATRLQGIMDRDRLVLYQEIPNQPAGEPYRHLTGPGGLRIEIVAIPIGPESPEAVEWKFSAQTVSDAEALWDVYRNRPIVVGTGGDAPQILSLQISDWIFEYAPALAERTVVLENWQWLGLILIIVLGMTVSRILIFILIRVLRRYFRNEHLSLDPQLENEVARPLRVAIMARVWFIALRPLNLPPEALDPLKIATSTISTLALVWAFYKLINIVGTYLTARAARTDTKYDDMFVPLIVKTLKIVAILLGVFLCAHAMSFRIETVLTGMGIGGLAIALAAKDTVGNVFGSLAILFDRPFEIGDWVTIGDVDGTVEKVGIRSTRIRTFYNSLITVPNSVIINATIDNYGQRRFRRIRIFLGITYDTPPDKIEAFCEGIREVIRQHPYTRKDYYHVYLNNFSESSLDILLYCFQECPDWSTELRERQRLFLDILRLAKRLGVEFAFPTQTLFMNPEKGDAASSGNGLNSDEALALGQKAGRAVVEEGMGKSPPLPPPVSFAPVRQKPTDGFDDSAGD